MEWVAVITWGLVVAFALPLLRGASNFPPLGLQVVAAVSGLALCVVFLAVGHPSALAWSAFGAAVVGLLCAVAGAAWLTGDRHGISGPAQQRAEEVEATMEGVELGLFGLVATFALLMALGVATLN
jgi:uncharacterized membrane protein